MVCTPASHLGEWSSIPHKGLTFVVFVGIAQTLRAKITPFQWKDFGKTYQNNLQIELVNLSQKNSW